MRGKRAKAIKQKIIDLKLARNEGELHYLYKRAKKIYKRIQQCTQTTTNTKPLKS